MFAGTLEAQSLLIVGFERQGACAAASVLDVDVLHRVWNALAGGGSNDQRFPNQAGPKCTNRAKQFGLDNVANSLRRVAGSPGLDGLIECSSLPPIRVFTCTSGAGQYGGRLPSL